jgi:DNA-binding response OmpR family regulator
MTRLLLVEDDKLFNETLEDFLEDEGFVLDTVLDPYSALDLSYEHNYDLYLFDVNLPYESGFELLAKLREAGDETPCIFLTSREDKDSLHQGFGSGADDYLKKPVDLDELLLRIEAVLRRQVRTQKVQVGEYSFDSLNKCLYKDEEQQDLSSKAGELLLVLLEGKGELVPLSHIKERLWSFAENPSDGALRVYITQLKKYFPTQIQNIRSLGYKMNLK